MKHHAKAPSAGSSSSSGRGAPLAFLLACALALLFGVSSASATAPTATAGSASAVEATTATLNGEVDPADLETSYHFEYVSQADFNEAEFAFATQAGFGSLPALAGATPVKAELGGLAPATTYHFRLIAENPDGPSESVAASTFTTKAAAPALITTSVSALTPNTATLNATINPNGAATTYHFEFIDAATYEATGFTTATHLPVPDAGAGGGTSEHTVSQKLTGLTLDTSYRYRVLATNSEGTATIPAKAFRTFALPAAPPTGAFPGQGFLTDNRAWEVVSPADKNGGNISAFTERTQAAADGNAVKFSSTAAFADAHGTGIAIDYLTRRDATPGTSGWSTHAITPRLEPSSIDELLKDAIDPRYLMLSDDLAKGIFIAPPKSPLVPSPFTENTITLSLRADLLDPGPAAFQLLNQCPACTSPLPEKIPSSHDGRPAVAIAAASNDFTHILFESGYNLTADASGESPDSEIKLYEWDHGTVRLAGILPNGKPAECEPGITCSVAGRGAGGLVIGRYVSDTISADGSRLVFTVPIYEGELFPGSGRFLQHDSAGGYIGDLYLRTDHTTTVQLNASERTPPSPTASPADFQGASSDLSQLFFITEEQLTADDPSTAPSLYRYNANFPASDPHNLTLISADSEPDDGTDGLYVRSGVVGVSDDGDYVYFYSISELIDNGGPGVQRSCSTEILCLYVWHDGILHFVTQSSNEEAVVIAGSTGWSLGRPKGSRLTPDGTHLLFLSEGVDGIQYDYGHSCDPVLTDPETETDYYQAVSGTPLCAELYLYDATASGGAGKTTCVSCAPGGTHLSTSEARLAVQAFEGTRTPHLSHAISDDGRYVFFSTGERLVPEDTNGRYDAYVYDTQSGQRHLLSSGRSDSPSFFLDASADGSDAFFTTRQALTGWDRDGQVDLYDARIDGGIADPPLPPPTCQGDACQPPLPDLNDPTPASSSVIGPADPVPNRGSHCPRGKRLHKAKGKSRCVARKHKRKPQRAHTSTPSHG